jgi:hypothetical protein
MDDQKVKDEPASEPTRFTEEKHNMRVFAGGATRDTDQGKLDYVRALSPIVLKRYLQYLDKHRHTAGGLRAFDNWKQGIPTEVYLSSDFRHLFDAWLALQGFRSEQDIEESLCGQLFNVMGMLHEILIRRGYLSRNASAHMTCGMCAKHATRGDVPGACRCPTSDLIDPGCFEEAPR